MNSWQKRQAANGLCIFCNRPAASGNGTKAPKCEVHREKLRKINGHTKHPYMSWQDRKQRRTQIADFAVTNPTMSVKELAMHFTVTDSTVYTALEENNVIAIWVKNDLTTMAATAGTE